MAFDNVRNYYEELVFNAVSAALAERDLPDDDDFAEDVACVTLNNLQPRYVHHNIYLAFYLSSEERRKIDEKIKETVQEAMAFVDTHRR